jgi:hypothetical protein
VVVVVRNPRAYATIEAYGEELVSPVILQFQDKELGRVLDTIEIPAGTSIAVLRTIPLVARSILVRVVGSRPNRGRVTVFRVLVPKPSAGIPHGFTESITPVISYRATIDTSRRELYQVAASVPMLQISKPMETVVCTAFLVTHDTLATAGHCVRVLMLKEMTPKWQAAPCISIGILFDYVDSSTSPEAPAAHCQAVRILPESDVPVELSDICSLTFDKGDVAVLRIDPALTKLPDGGFRQPLAVKDLRNKSLASVISYPQGDIEGVANDCEVYGNIQRTFVLHRCSTAPGSSGAPVMELTRDGWRVVGLHICCDCGPIDSFTRPLLNNAAKRANLALRPSVTDDLLR